MDRTNTEGHRLLELFVANRTIKDVAKDANLHPMQLSHLLHRRRGASLEVAVAIEKATGGKIPANSWVAPEKHK